MNEQPSSGKTIRQVIDAYLPQAQRETSARTFADKAHVLNRLAESLGDSVAGELQADAFEAWLAAWPEAKSPHTIHRVIGTVKRCLNWAAEIGMIAKNPLATLHSRGRTKGWRRPKVNGKPAPMPAPPSPKPKKPDPAGKSPRAVALNRRRVTVADVLDWCAANETRELSKEHVHECNRQLAAFREFAGHLQVKDCNAAMLLDWIMNYSGAKANHTRRRVKAAINYPFNYAVLMGLIPTNPFKGVKFPSGRQGKDWSAEEYQTVLRMSGPHFRRVVVFLRFTGCRQGEMRGLKWSQIDEEARVIVLQHHKTEHHGHGPRRIYLNAVIAKLLLWIRKQDYPGEFVFTNTCGNKWWTNTLTKYLRSVCRRAGWLPGAVRLHGLRHRFCTQAIINGVDIATVAQLVGHSQIATTQRYLHLIDKSQHLNNAADRAVGSQPKPQAS